MIQPLFLKGTLRMTSSENNQGTIQIKFIKGDEAPGCLLAERPTLDFMQVIISGS